MQDTKGHSNPQLCKHTIMDGSLFEEITVLSIPFCLEF